MADWFQVDSNLGDKPEVRQIRRATREEVATICGRLVLFWALVDQHGDLLDEDERPGGSDLDGIIPGYCLEDLEDTIGGSVEFWQAVCSTGWLAAEERGLLVPGFERRFETNAKRRAAAARRKRRQRNRDAGITGTSTKASRTPVAEPELPDDRQRVTKVTPGRDESVTRGEERRGEKKTEQKISSPSAPPAKSLPPVKSSHSQKNSGGRGEGNDLFWQQLVRKPGALRQAVKKQATQFFERAWTEAAAAGWVRQDDRETRRRFLAACFYACNPPPGFEVDNPARLVRQKLIETDWRTGCNASGADDDFAKRLERKLDGAVDLPRQASLMPTQRSAADEIARLRAVSGAT
ncbi:MAG: hypothetical protein ACYTGL_14010 [Planctomycetota bacterium]|jgi:hypothetical protein